MKRILAALAMLSAAPAVAIPPALPPADEFKIYVDGAVIRCRLPQPGGPLTQCLLQDSLYLLSITIQRTQTGAFRYAMHRNCLVPESRTQGFDFASRSGELAATKSLAVDQFETDLRFLLELKTKAECESLVNWPHQLPQMMPRLEKAFAVFRSLRFE